MKARQFNNHAETLIGQISNKHKQHESNDDPRLLHSVGNANDTGSDNRVDQVATGTDQARLFVGHGNVGDLMRRWLCSCVGAIIGVAIVVVVDGDGFHPAIWSR